MKFSCLFTCELCVLEKSCFYICIVCVCITSGVGCNLIVWEVCIDFRIVHVCSVDKEELAVEC